MHGIARESVRDDLRAGSESKSVVFEEEIVAAVPDDIRRDARLNLDRRLTLQGLTVMLTVNIPDIP